MISLSQIQELEAKISTAVTVIKNLKEENTSVKDKLGSYQKRIEELEILISKFKSEQDKIEEGIINALKQLDKIEDSVNKPSAEPGKPVIQTPQPEAELPQPAPAEEPAPPRQNEQLDIF
jgi:FtsZ-binding cell division protein ZapB